MIDWVVAYFTFLYNTWNTILTTIQTVATNIWTTIQNTITGVVDKVKEVWDGIVSFFTGIWDKVTAGATTIKDAITGAFKGAIDGAKKAFKSGINWIIDKINNIIKGVNKVASKIPGVGDKLKIAEIPELASGGYVNFASGGGVSGAGSGTSDSIPAMLSNGEYVLRAEVVRNLGVDNLDALNEGKKPGRDAPLIGEMNVHKDADPMALAQQIGAEVRWA